MERPLPAWRGLDPERDTAVIGRHGARSLRAALFLGRVGFERAVNLDGGADARSRDVDPTVPLC